MNTDRRNALLHHLGSALVIVGLALWFLAGRQLGILDWGTQLLPSHYAAVGFTLSVMLLMLPAFIIWNRFNRWLERKLSITGHYYENSDTPPVNPPDQNT